VAAGIHDANGRSERALLAVTPRRMAGKSMPRHAAVSDDGRTGASRREGGVTDTLVGRERELLALAGWLDEVRGGATRLVMCVGEPGVGKTRLAEEFVVLARRAGVGSVWGRSDELEGAPPYWLWRQVFQQLQGRPEMAAALQRIGAGRGSATSALDALRETPTGGGEDDAVARFRLFDAVSRVLGALSEHGGLMLLFDDVHWADASSVRLLQHVLRDPGSGRLLVLAMHRDDDPRVAENLLNLSRLPSAVRLTLAGLSVEAVGRQLMAARGATVPAGLVRRVHDLTGGNPFYVGELAHDLDHLRTPATVRATIARRAAALPAPARALLDVASVVGRQFSTEVLAAVVERTTLTVTGELHDAVTARLIEPVSEERGEYRFTHALTRQAIEDGLPVHTRRSLHRSVGAAIERLFAGSIEAHLADLAHHAIAAAVDGGSVDAVAWAERAADQAMRALAFEDAARLYRAALDAGGDVVSDEQRYRLLLGAAHAARAMGDHLATREAAIRAAALGRRLGRSDLAAEAVLVMECLTTVDWDRDLRDACLRALAELGDDAVELRARLLGRLAETQENVGDLAAAAASSRQALTLAERCGHPVALASALRARRLVCAGAQHVSERSELADRMARLANAAGSPAAEMTAVCWSIDAGFAEGDLDRVAGDLERLEWIVARVGGPVARWQLLRYRGAHAQARGDFTAARAHGDAAFSAIEATGHPAALPIRLQLHGVIDHHTGADPAGASVRAARAAGPGTAATPGHGYRVMDLIGPAFLLAGAGLFAEAKAKFVSLGPVETWQVPPAYQLTLYALGIQVAIRIDQRTSVRALHTLLTGYRGRHVVAGMEVTHYLGPVDLWLGKASRHLGDRDASIDDLAAAIAIAQKSATPAFLVEAQCELAAALLERRSVADLAAAADVIEAAAPVADRLGMAPYRSEIDRLAPELAAPEPSPLTVREHDIAALVALGLSNREIAGRLYISERTAQTHVQHILTKLGFRSRTEIAVWFTGSRHPPPPRRT
jgi:DNA-binding CsgD family transcriptional regulator